MREEEAPLVLETPGGLSVSYRGRLLYSGREPAKIPRAVARACDPGPARLLLAASPLLWYGLPELLETMGEGSAVLCVEADPALAALARERMPPELARDPRVAFLAGASAEEAASIAAALGSFRACSLVPISGGESLNDQAYRDMAALLSSRFEADWRNRAALMTLGHRWAGNIFDNLASLANLDIREFPRFVGAVVVCGAGPSLEDALPFMAAQKARGRIAVVACDTALGSLLASGIDPDLVVCLEAQAHNLADFTCLGARSIPLAADLSAHPASFRAVRGPKLLSFVRITRSPFLERVAAVLEASGLPYRELPPLGSVGVHAARLAMELTGGPILAAGLDFCFEAGKTHARGCPSLLAEERKLSRLSRWAGQFAYSFRERSVGLGGEAAAAGGRSRLLSDPVMLTYAALMREAALSDSGGRALPGGPGGGARAGGPRLYDIRGRGPELGMRRITLAEAEAVAEAPPRGGAAEARAPRPAAPRAEGAVRLFLEGEAARLEALREALRGGGARSRGDLARLVSEVDYLYWSFPDRGRAGELAQDFLNRLVPSLEYWSSRIGGLRS